MLKLKNSSPNGELEHGLDHGGEVGDELVLAGDIQHDHGHVHHPGSGGGHQLGRHQLSVQMVSCGVLQFRYLEILVEKTNVPISGTETMSKCIKRILKCESASWCFM